MVTNIGDLQVRDDFIVTIAGTVIDVRGDEFLLQDSTGQVWVDAVRGGPGTIDLATGEQVTVTGDLDDLEDFDAARIVRADGTEVAGQPLPSGRPGSRPGNGSGRPGNGNGVGGDRPINISNAPRVNIGDLQVRDDVFVTISGTVTRIQEDEFVLRDQTGQVLVDGIRRGSGRLDIAVGDRLTVVGDLDDEDFDAVRITRADGSVVAAQPAQRWNGRGGGNSRNNGRNGRGGDFSAPPPWAGRPDRNGRGSDFGGPPPWAGRLSSPRNVLQADILSGQDFAVDSSIL